MRYSFYSKFLVLVFTFIIAQHPTWAKKDYVLRNGVSFKTSGVYFDSKASDVSDLHEAKANFYGSRDFVLEKTDLEDLLHQIHTDMRLSLKVVFHKSLDSFPYLIPDVFEGMTIDSAMAALLEDLWEFIDRNPNSINLHQVATALHLALYYEIALVDLDQKHVKERIDTTKELEELTQMIKGAVRETTPGGPPLLIPGGIRRFFDSGGHAFHYSITSYYNEKGERKLNFEIINRGLGLDFHPRSIGHDQKNIFQSFYITNIDPKAIEESSLIDRLIDLKVASPRNAPFLPFVQGPIERLRWNQGFAIKKVYDIVKEELIEKGGGAEVRLADPRLWHHEQRWGTCTMKSLLGWVKENLSHEEMKALRFFLAERSSKQLARILSDESQRAEAAKIVESSQNYDTIKWHLKNREFLPILYRENEIIRVKRHHDIYFDDKLIAGILS